MLLKISKCKLAKTFLVQHIENLETKISGTVSDMNANKLTEHLAEIYHLDGTFS